MTSPRGPPTVPCMRSVENQIDAGTCRPAIGRVAFVRIAARVRGGGGATPACHVPCPIGHQPLSRIATGRGVWDLSGRPCVNYPLPNGRPRDHACVRAHAWEGARPGCVVPRPWSGVGMDSDRIRTDTNSDVTICHILFRIRIRIRILSNTNTKWIFRIRIHIRILTRFTA
jgi:hypothetical protein